jgi:hypothetical protein
MRTFALVLLVACGNSDPPIDAMGLPDAPPRQVVMETRMLQLGDVQEATLTGGAGDLAVVTLAAPHAALDWNIHGHPPGMSTITIHEELRVMTAQYRFIPTMQADWSLLLRNRHTDAMNVEVKIDLYGDIQWAGF